MKITLSMFYLLFFTLSSWAGTVTQANMRLSLVNGTAFVDFNGSDSGALTSAAAGTEVLITDSSGHVITGYKKANGSGQTYGSQLLSNTSFTTTAGVTVWNNSTIASVAGGYTGDALQLTNTGAGYGSAYQGFTTTTGALYQASAYFKVGTDFQGDVGIATSDLATVIIKTASVSSTWTPITQYVTAAGVGYIQFYGSNTVTVGATDLFSVASAEPVLTPASTGVTITSTANGSTYNWASIGGSFNYNDSNGYTYSVGLVANPQLSRLPASYAPGITVSLTDSTAGAVICYTTNGVTPTAATPGTCDQNTYSGPLTITSSALLQTIGTITGGPSNSGVVSGGYYMGTGVNYFNTDSSLNTGTAQTGTATASTNTDPIVDATSGGAVLWQLVPNAWGAGSSFTGSSTVAYPGTGTVTETVNEGALPPSGVNGYPDIFFGGDIWGDQIGTGPIILPSLLSHVGSLVVDVAYTLANTVTPTDQDIGFDQWLTPTNPFSGGSGGALEVFICTYYYFNGSNVPPGSSLVATWPETVLLNGVLTTLTYSIYSYGRGVGYEVLIVPPSNLTSGEIQFNMLDFLNEAALVEGVSGFYVAGFNWGTEYGVGYGGQTAVNYSLTSTKVGIEETILGGGPIYGGLFSR